MILFKEDWDKYPDAIVDTKTRNKSFYIMAIKYRLMGVKNHAFLLSLLDPSLQGVDPFDEENLTRDQKDRIIVECMRNPWYYFREIIMIPETGSNGINLLANRGNIALFFMFFCHVFVVLIQIRQTGKSVNTDGLKSYGLFFGLVNAAINFLTNNTRNRIESVERIKIMEKMLPSYMRIIGPNDICNTERIHIRDTNVKYETSVSQTVLERAKTVFRGSTAPINHIDEFAYIWNLKLSLTAMLKSANAARDQAKSNNTMYGTILSSTAGYKDTPHGEYAYKVYKSCAVFTEKLFDSKNREDLEKKIRLMSPESLNRVLIEMNHRQLGKTDAWLNDKIEETASEGNDTLTDFFNVWVSSYGIEIISDDDKKRISGSKLQDYNPEISNIEGYTLRWYVSDEEKERIINSNEPLVAGMDTSEAIGKDDISLIISKVSTGEVVAAADYNETNITVFGEYVVSLLVKYPSLTLIVERRSTGTSIIDSVNLLLLQHNINPMNRVFNWATHNKDKDDKSRAIYRELMDAFERRDRKVFDKYKTEFGYATSGSGRTSRDKLYGDSFTSAVKYIGDVTRDITLVNQILELKNINGRIDHPKGGHDDMVIGWLLIFWFLKNTSNLKDYGIKPEMVLINVKGLAYKDGKLDIDRAIRLKRHKDAMQAIDILTEKMRVTSNMLERKECKQMMHKLSNFLDYTITPNFNIDTYISNLENKKKNISKYD